VTERVPPGRRDRRAWWSTRLLALVEGMSPPDPLRTGRALVRTESVLSMRRSGNLVVALVRDPNEDLHKARLAVRTFGDADWDRLTEALAAEARYAAALLAGGMPAGLEKVCAALGLALFPTRADDLAMDCTCPDWQRPCAHLVAAGHQLADAVDLDPFTLLALRGRERDALLAQIRRRRPPGAAREPRRPPASAWPAGSGTADPAAEACDPLPHTPAAFWSSPLPAGGVDAVPSPPARPDILLELCGPLEVDPLGDLRAALRAAYKVFGT